MRPTLTLKKRPAVDLIKADEPIEVKKSVQVTETENLPKAIKASKQSEKFIKEARAEANRLLGQEQYARRAANLLKMKPIVQEYLNSQPLMREIVKIDDVECLRPLAIGVHKTFLAHLRGLPEAQDCSSTVINELMKGVIEKHVAKLQYKNGLLKFSNRFNLDGSSSDVISDEIKNRIKKRMDKEIRKQEQSKSVS